jgi:hypothetical protein
MVSQQFKFIFIQDLVNLLQMDLNPFCATYRKIYAAKNSAIKTEGFLIVVSKRHPYLGSKKLAI